MINWIKNNGRLIRRIAYIIPILIASVFSISHVIAWYELTNPMSWAIYLSVGIEIAALSSLAGIVADRLNKSVYFPFVIVTLIQFVGNIFFCFQYIDVNSELFKQWMDLVGPIFDSMGLMGAEDFDAHKRFLAFLAGGTIPLISLSFLHLLVKGEENDAMGDENPKNDDPNNGDGQNRYEEGDDTESEDDLNPNNNEDDQTDKEESQEQATNINTGSTSNDTINTNTGNTSNNSSISNEDLQKIRQNNSKNRGNNAVERIGSNKEVRSNDPKRMVFNKGNKR